MYLLNILYRNDNGVKIFPRKRFFHLYCKIFCHRYFKPCPAIFVCCGFLLGCHFPVFSSIKHPYLTMGFGYTQNIAKGNTANIKIYQRPNQPLPPTKLKMNNNKSANGIEVSIDAGERFQLNQRYDWSLGWRIRHAQLNQQGYEQYVGGNSPLNYTYTTTNTLFSLVARLIMKHVAWQYYIELHAGIALVNSNNYRNTQINDQYMNKTVANPAYGAGLGLAYFISPQTSIGFKLDYTNLGDAVLGTRNFTPPSVAPLGQIKQKQQLVSSVISITHWF